MKFRKHMIMQQAEAGTMAGGAGGASTGEPDTSSAATTENQASGTQDDSESGTQDQNKEFSVDSLPEEAQKIIKDLRAENAKSRTDKNNVQSRLEKIENGFKTMFGEDGEQDLPPEKQLEQLQGNFENISYENAVLGMAYENGIPMDNYEYFSFLMQKEANGLEEGQELSDEQLLSVIQKAKGFTQSQGDTNTSVDDSGQAPADGNTSTGLTLEGFTNMNVVQKSELYRKSPEIYTQFMKQAKEKKLL